MTNTNNDKRRTPVETLAYRPDGSVARMAQVATLMEVIAWCETQALAERRKDPYGLYEGFAEGLEYVARHCKTIINPTTTDNDNDRETQE